MNIMSKILMGDLVNIYCLFKNVMSGIHVDYLHLTNITYICSEESILNIRVNIIKFKDKNTMRFIKL